MKDSEFIHELKKYKAPEKEHWQTDNGARCVAFFMTPKQWTEFRRKFNSPIEINKDDK